MTETKRWEDDLPVIEASVGRAGYTDLERVRCRSGRHLVYRAKIHESSKGREDLVLKLAFDADDQRLLQNEVAVRFAFFMINGMRSDATVEVPVSRIVQRGERVLMAERQRLVGESFAESGSAIPESVYRSMASWLLWMHRTSSVMEQSSIRRDLLRNVEPPSEDELAESFRRGARAAVYRQLITPSQGVQLFRRYACGFERRPQCGTFDPRRWIPLEDGKIGLLGGERGGWLHRFRDAMYPLVRWTVCSTSPLGTRCITGGARWIVPVLISMMT